MMYQDGEIKDILPSWLRERADVQAISYAIKQQADKLRAYQAYIYGYAWIDNAPEYVLDLMAVELNVRYYDESYSIDVKRSLIKGAILVALKDGTMFAVDSVISTIWGDGHGEGWDEYGGTPNHFRVLLDELHDLTDIDTLVTTIESVKRKTARLDAVDIKQPVNAPLYFAEIMVEVLTQYVGAGAVPATEISYYTDEAGNILMDEDCALLFKTGG